MHMTMLRSSASTPADLARLRAFVAARGAAALSILDRHLARPRYRPAFTRIAERAGQIAGYALIGHERLRLGTATLEAGRIAAIELAPDEHDPSELAALLGDCLRVLVEEQLPLALLCRPIEVYAPFGFAPYRFMSQVQLAPEIDTAPGPALRRATESDIDDLAALYDAAYQALPLTAARSAHDWRFWLAGVRPTLAIEDKRGRLIAYATVEHGQAGLTIAEAAAADAGAARVLCNALRNYTYAQGLEMLLLTLSPWHTVAQAALHLNGTARLAAHSARVDRQGSGDLAGVVDLPLLLEALAPEFERRLARSRYAGWSGNLRMEIETERITLAFAEGRATVIDGSRPADLRLRQITLPALAQLCLGYRVAADLRDTGGLACDDSALGLLDALFPAVLATK